MTNKKLNIQLVASGDLRLSANQTCWPAQEGMEKSLIKVIEAKGHKVERAHAYSATGKHGFISSQRQGMDVFSKIDRKAPLIVAEAVWQYSHHVLAGLICDSDQTCALGSAMFAAVVGGAQPDIFEAMDAMGGDYKVRYQPNSKRLKYLDTKYMEYKKLGMYIETF